MPIDPLDTLALTTCSVSDLLAAQADVVARRRRVEAEHAAIAGEIARRSAPDAGMAGIAQSAGDRTAARFLERTAGVTADEARRLIEVGGRISDPADRVGSAVVSGELSVAVASAITSELARVVGDVPADRLDEAEEQLIIGAAGLSASEVRREARHLRDELDVEGIPEREERLHAERRLALHPLPTGMTRIEGLLDPESAALVTDAFDQALSPRRGGPRFVDRAEVARAERIAEDPRTTEQLMLDTFVQIVRIAVGADPGGMFGSTTPAVRVHVTQRDLQDGAGYAILEGQEAPVSLRTAERMLCAGSQAILFDTSGAIIDLGREQRLFTRAQRRGLAARDGGCLAPGCDRPPSWTEAHHTDEWYAHGGRTDVERGVLLCAHHHRWVHAHRHRVIIRDEGYGMIDGTTGAFTPWPSKNRLRARLLAPV